MRIQWIVSAMSVELFIFVTRYGKNDVCQFLAYLYYPRETFRIALTSLHCPLSVCLRGALCPKMSAATPPLPKSVVLARGAASTVTLLSVRTPDFLLCSFYALARSESLWCPVPTHTPRPCPSSRLFCATSARSLYLSHIPLSLFIKAAKQVVGMTA